MNAGTFWDDPASTRPDAPNAGGKSELSGPDANGNEWTVGLYGNMVGHEAPIEMVGDVGLDRRSMP